MITANTLLLFGSGLKLISVDFISFELAFGGQVLVALAQVIILNIPSTLAFEWFAAKEKTTSKGFYLSQLNPLGELIRTFPVCNLSIFGMQLGMLLGFAITPLVVENHDEDLDAIAEDLNNLNYLHVALSFTSLFLVLGSEYNKTATTTTIKMSFFLFQFSAPNPNFPLASCKPSRKGVVARNMFSGKPLKSSFAPPILTCSTSPTLCNWEQ